MRNKEKYPILLDIDKPVIKLLQEWNETQFAKVRRKIAVHFMKSYTYCDNWLGLAYTSSSSCAAEWVCNGVDAMSKKYPTHRYIGFAMGEDGNVYAILWDKDENEILEKL